VPGVVRPFRGGSKSAREKLNRVAGITNSLSSVGGDTVGQTAYGTTIVSRPADLMRRMPQWQGACVVQVRNTTTLALAKFAVVGLQDTTYDRDDPTVRVSDPLTIDAGTPDIGDPGRVAILQERLEPQQHGPAMVAGATWAKVRWHRPRDEDGVVDMTQTPLWLDYADVHEDETATLESAWHGPCKILAPRAEDLPTPNPAQATPETWAIVSIGTGAAIKFGRANSNTILRDDDHTVVVVFGEDNGTGCLVRALDIPSGY